MRDKVRPGPRVAALAAGQHGVVSGAQLAGLGVSRAARARAVEAGRLHRLHRGVFAVGHAAVTHQGASLAAVLACGPDALLSHGSAGWLWGLFGTCPAIPEVTVPRRGHARSGIRVHRVTTMDSADRARCEDIPVVAVARTLLDISASGGARRLQRAVERAERLGLLDLIEVDAMLARNRGRKGVPALRSALEIYRDPAFTRSRAERLLLDALLRGGVSRPAMNAFVAGLEIDAYWEAERFAVEVDGWEFHRSRAAFERDPLRQEQLKLAGIDSIRVTARRLEREPGAVAERIGALLARRRSELGLG
jgi:very-short-patch-repair endonuclease